MSDTTVETYPEDEAQDEAQVPTSEATEAKVRKAPPTYAIKTLDGDIPDHAKITRSNTGRQVYMELLGTVVADEDLWGQWVEVAEFNTYGGAKDAMNAIRDGERHVPNGEWSITYRRLVDENSGDRFSRLYAKFDGPSDEVKVSASK